MAESGGGGHLGRMKTPALLALLLASSSPALAAPADDRAAAFEVLNQQAVVERGYSNCRWIRGERDEKGEARWRSDNRPVIDAAMAVLSAQGGLTARRREVVDGLAGLNAGEAGRSREACRAFFAEAKAGTHDLTVRVPMHLLRQVLAFRAPEGEPVTWVLEQRRQPTGVLAYAARRWTGEGGIAACEADAATLGHIHLRQRVGKDMQMVPDPDPELWLAECMRSPVEPVTGAPVQDPA